MPLTSATLACWRGSVNHANQNKKSTGHRPSLAEEENNI